MFKTKIKISILTGLLLATLMPITSVYASEAPPSLDLGSLLDEPAADADAPPSFNVDGLPDNNDNNDGNAADDNNNDNALKISGDSADPRSFNPLITDTTIKYKLSGDARVDVEIFDARNQKVATLTNNQALAKGDYNVKWHGTANNQQNGTIVANGEYTYKITAKDPDSGVAQDTATGNITVNYSRTNPTNPVTTPRPLPPVGTQNPSGTLVLQNMQSGRTSDTGPAMLLYSVFPLAGYIFTRRKK